MSTHYNPAPASDALLAARRECRPLDGFPGHIPQTLADAYAVQMRSLPLWGGELVGFKVGGIPMGYREAYGGTWLAGPIFADDVQRVGNGGEAYVTVYDGGFAAYEAEYVFRVSGLSRLSGPVDTIEAAIAHIDTVHIGAEIASSPMAAINDLGPGAIISDFGNNAGMIIGPEVGKSVIDRLSGITVTTEIDGERIGRAAAKPGEDGPLGAVRFLLDHISTERDPATVPDALWVSSGAVTGVHSSQAGTEAKITFGELGGFTLRMVPRLPK